MNRPAQILLASVGLFSLALPSFGGAHDFEETRRLVLSVESDHLELFVAYEVRPGRRADSLSARYDRHQDGRIATPFERLARAQTVSPRLRHGLSVLVDGEEVVLSLEQLAFPPAEVQGGRFGISAVGLYGARLDRRARPGAPLSIVVRTRGARGRVTLEAQAADGYQITGTGLESRRGDPVIGPGVLGRSDGATLVVSASAR